MIMQRNVVKIWFVIILRCLNCTNLKSYLFFASFFFCSKCGGRGGARFILRSWHGLSCIFCCTERKICNSSFFKIFWCVECAVSYDVVVLPFLLWNVILNFLCTSITNFHQFKAGLENAHFLLEEDYKVPFSTVTIHHLKLNPSWEKYSALFHLQLFLILTSL